MPILRITDAAAQRVREIATMNDSCGIRLSIKKGGCAGMEYKIDLVKTPNPKDDHIEKDGAHIYIAAEASIFLCGTEIDFQTTSFRSGFVFLNPNEASSCGCGESVFLKPSSSSDYSAEVKK